MKKFHLNLIAVILLFAFNGCKKENVDSSPLPSQFSKEVMSKKINDWLSQKIQDAQPDKQPLISSLKEALDFNQIRVEAKDASQDFLVIGLKNDFTPLYNKRKTPVNQLVLLIDKEQNIQKGNIVQYAPKEGSFEFLPEDVMANIFNHKPVSHKGVFSFLTLEGFFAYELIFDGGKRPAVKVTKAVSAGTQNGRALHCTDWYWVTTWSDGSETRIYAFTTCTGGNPGGCWDWAVDCGGGSGGGGGGGNDIDYVYAVSKAVNWRVEDASITNGNELPTNWYVQSYETLEGTKTTGGEKKFSDIKHDGSAVYNNTIDGNNPNQPRATWQEFQAVRNFTNTTAEITISGKVTSLSVDYAVNNKTQTWQSSVLP